MAAQLAAGKISAVHTIIPDFLRENLVSHDTDSLFAEQWKRLGDGNVRNANVLRKGDVFHGQDLRLLDIIKMLVWVKDG